MRKIVVLGNSVGLIPLLNQLRAQNSEDEITVLSVDGHFPYDWTKVVSWITSKKKNDDLLSEGKEYYKEKNIRVETELRVTRINLNRKRIHFNDKTQTDFDVLIICNTPEVKFLDIKGTNKEGVYSLNRFDHIKDLVKKVPLVDTISIQADSLQHFELALSLAENEREVFFISKKDKIFGLAKDSKGFELLSEACFSKGVMIVTESEISELLGDHDLKAIRLNSGKVISSQMVVFQQVRGDVRVFSEHLAVNDHKICTDSNGQTNIEGVYAFDYVSIKQDQPKEKLTDYQIVEQARKIAAHIASEGYESSPATVKEEFSIGDLSFVSIKQQGISTEGCDIRINQTDTGSYEQYYLKDEKIVSAVLINAVSKVNDVFEAVEQGKEYSQVIENNNLTIDSDPPAEESLQQSHLPQDGEGVCEKAANPDA